MVVEKLSGREKNKFIKGYPRESKIGKRSAKVSTGFLINSITIAK